MHNSVKNLAYIKDKINLIGLKDKFIKELNAKDDEFMD